MARYYEEQWPAYVSVAERRREAERQAGKLSKKGSVLSPVLIDGKKIASTFWGKAWCDNLESYRDYANRLERGRSYVRNGLVIDLRIAPHVVTAMVSGSSVYTVKITIGEVPKAQWQSICADCAGGIDSMVELLQGRFAKGVMERICRQGVGLFPKPADIKFSCSCLDHASMCKHVAAALYGVGARLDTQPELLFRLRAVNENDLVANIGNVLPMSKSGPAAGKVLEADDMAALFGLDMGDATGMIEAVAPPPLEREAAAPPSPKRKAPATVRNKAGSGVKPVAGKAVRKAAVRARTVSPKTAEPKSEARRKPAPSKQDKKVRTSTRGPAKAN